LAGALYGAVVRWIVGRSRATVYVTKRTLQRRVPPPPGRPTLVASNVRLSPDDFVVRTGHFGPWDASRPLRIVSVGSMESPVKGFDLLIRATSDLRASGVFVTADLVGSGRLEPELKELSQTCGVADHVTFHGHIGDRAELFRIVDGSDVFVLPSRSEGLPRAMIEAMARGACVAGSAIGGIVELADPSCLFPPEQLESMVDCLQRLYLDPTRVAQLAEEGQRLAAEVMAEAEPARVTALLRVLAGPPATSRTGAGPRAIPGAGA
jgi:glycosyltransferase involved in cell wall biosynthesis